MLILSIDATIQGAARIYLDPSTIGASVHPMDIFKEYRALRVTDLTLRPFVKGFLSQSGRKPTSAGKFTQRIVTCNNGTRIVPAGSLTITGTIITDSGQEGVDCFDKALSPPGDIDISYIPKQVEILEINTGSGISAQDKIDIVDLIFSRTINGAETLSSELATLKNIGIQNIEIDDVTGIMTLFEPDMTTVMFQWQLFEDSAGLVKYNKNSAKIHKRVKL